MCQVRDDIVFRHSQWILSASQSCVRSILNHGLRDFIARADRGIFLRLIRSYQKEGKSASYRNFKIKGEREEEASSTTSKCNNN